TVNGKPYTIVGVMPAGFVYPDRQYQVWSPLPLVAAPDLPPINRQSHYLQVIARLKANASEQQAQAEMTTIAGRLARQFHEDEALGVRISPLTQQVVKGGRTALLVLLGAVGFVVLIACTNVTSLLLARASGRQRRSRSV